ncbi:histidine phosphatase family protein [Streptomyces caniscabiei]|uniref:histidine phosphatase family protein n=1 Tax=Streptomyces caniscabiei TaxID=2746961 RepID=UPI0029B8C4A5|nr:histidine phosphatase family protein [Streptomyces caniscabiei]MDX2776604.1 histidine phosphatase family protein [Streptomyces caniscabiei]
MKITYFVHSITKDNEKGLATGWLPGELSHEGIKRARDVSQQIQDLQFDAVFSSDLRRAVHSAQLFFGDRFPTFLDWRLRECNYGDLDGTSAADFKKNREAEYIDTSYPSGESYKDVELRLRSFLADAAQLFPNGHIAIVAHQAPQLALEVIANGKPWQQAVADDWRRTGNWQPGWQYEV